MTRIFAGGRGEVYRGHNIETGEPGAIKTIIPGLSGSETMFALFRKDATVLGRVGSGRASCVATASRETRRSGGPVSRWEFVAGPSLADRIAERPLTVDEARRVFGRWRKAAPQSAALIQPTDWLRVSFVPWAAP